MHLAGPVGLRGTITLLDNNHQRFSMTPCI